MGIVIELDIYRAVGGSLDHLIGTDPVAFMQDALDTALVRCGDFAYD